MSLMMALNERCPNAWHMLIERLILIKALIRSGVQVSKRIFWLLWSKENKFLIKFMILYKIIKEGKIIV